MKQKYYVASAITIYVVLLSLYIALTEKSQIDNHCAWDRPCIRFCCDDMDYCSESYIRQNFDEKIVTEGIPEKFKKEIKKYDFLKGKPRCSFETISENSERNWTVHYKGDIIIDDKIQYNVDHYCFKEAPSNKEFKWNLLVCKSNYHFRQNLNYLLSFASICFLLSALFVYCYVRKLRSTISGKIFIVFVAILLSIYVFLALREFGIRHGFGDFENIGFAVLFVWMNVMSFDIWYSLRNIKNSIDSSRRFVYYCLFDVGFIGLGVGITRAAVKIFGQSRQTDNFMIWYFIISVFTLVVFDVIYFILAGILVNRLIKDDKLQDAFKLKSEKERFLLYIAIFIMMMVTWVFEFYTFEQYSSFDATIIDDIKRLFTAGLVFAAFVLKKDVRELFAEQYKGVIPKDGTQFNGSP